MKKLSEILMCERELLDTLLFRLEVEQMVLASGRTRWLMRSAREVEAVLATIRETEVLRAVAADEVAGAIGLGHNPSLRVLSGAVDEPWSTIFTDHHKAFVLLTREISALAESNHDLITAGYRSARATLRSIDGGAEEVVVSAFDTTTDRTGATR